MKFNTKKLLSVTSSLLIAAQQCFIAMPAGAVDAPSEAETYAQQIGLELNSGAAEDALSDLIDINDSDLTVAVDDNNNVTKIDGLLSDETVDNSNDAKDIIAKASELLGIDNVNREIRLDDVSESEYNRIYTFKQFYQGLEMVNSYITVVVDKETGEAEFLNSSVVSDFSIDTTSAISAQQAIDAVVAKFGQINVSSHKLAIYSEDNESFKLAWKLDTDLLTTKTVYVDATSGEVIKDIRCKDDTAANNNTIYSNNLLMSNVRRILPNNVYSFNVDIAKEGSLFKLHDMKRNAYIVMDPSYYLGNSFNARNSSKTVKSYNNQFTSSNDEQLAVAILYNYEKVYDFYKNTFDNYCGYDGKGAAMYIIPNLKNESQGRLSNAYSWGTFIGFGEGDGKNTRSYGSDIDTVGHEFTHCVTGYKIGWGSSGEAGAIDEGYSDIMGEYADMSREWIHSTDRVLGSNSSSTYKNLRHLSERKVYVNTADVNRIGSHAGGRIISHVAYWMDHLGIDATTGAKIWFNALDYLPKGATAATFKSLRTAMVKATQKVVQNRTQEETVRKVKTAFNRVHIYDTNEMIGDLTGDGVIDSFDIVIMRRVLSNTKALTSTERAQADLDFDGDVDKNDLVLLNKYVLGEIKNF